jgi:hypothetical protein
MLSPTVKFLIFVPMRQCYGSKPIWCESGFVSGSLFLCGSGYGSCSPAKVMQFYEHWSTDIPQFHFEPPSLLIAFTASIAPTPPTQYTAPKFDCDADPDPASQMIWIHADPDPQHCLRYEWYVQSCICCLSFIKRPHGTILLSNTRVQHLFLLVAYAHQGYLWINNYFTFCFGAVFYVPFTMIFTCCMDRTVSYGCWLFFDWFPI